MKYSNFLRAARARLAELNGHRSDIHFGRAPLTLTFHIWDPFPRLRPMPYRGKVISAVITNSWGNTFVAPNVHVETGEVFYFG